MKKYKLVNGEGWESSFKEGEIYDGSDKNRYGMTVETLATEGRFIEDWEEVLVSSSSNVYQVNTFTEAEIVTLITFLNDNFEEFKQFIEKVGEDKLDLSWWRVLDSINSGNRPQLLIDKIEKNEGLSLAEKVTLITFLNDNFEKFTDFVNNDLFNQDGLMLVYWARLDGSVLEASSLLIDKIERV